MVLNNKAQIAGYIVIFMLAILFFVFGYAIAAPLTQVSDDSQHNPSLNCSDPNLPTIQKTSCTQQDIAVPIYVGLCFALAGVVIGGAYKYG